MMWLLTFFMTLFTAHAAPSSSWVVVDRAAWIYTAPRANAVRVRAVEVESAPPHTLTPIVVLQLVRKGVEFAEVRTVVSPLAMTEAYHAKAPDLTPDTWPHCYPPPPALAQLSNTFFVRNQDLLPVLTKPVTVTHPDGASVSLEPGLAITGGSKDVRRVRGHHLEMTLAVPRDAIGTSYTLPAARELTGRLMLERPDGEVVAAHPQLRLRLRGHEGTLTTRAPEIETSAKGTVKGLKDRCASTTFAQPLIDLPIDKKDDTIRWPLFVPDGSVITLTSGEILGTVSASDMPMWSRQGCEWSPATGMCCPRPTGLELDLPDGEAPGVCFLADPPESHRNSGLRSIIGDQADDHSEFVAAFEQGERSVSWSVQNIDGNLTVADLSDPIMEIEGMFDHCYLLGLQVTPTMRGTLDTTITLMPNGRVQYARGVWDVPPPHENDRTAPCIERTLSKITVLNQIGQAPTTAVVRLEMTR